MLENVEISGLPAWSEIRLTQSAEKAVRTAEIQLAWAGDGAPCWPGDEVSISAGGDLLLTGYVRDVRMTHDASSRDVSVSVCSRTVDATECSVEHPTGECLDKSLDEIGQEFDGLGIGIETDGPLPKEPRHHLRPGETLFATLERRARGRGVLIYDTPEGKLKLATKPEGTHAGGLIYGENIENASAALTEQGRYSAIKVRGQQSSGTDKQQMRPQAVAKDSGITRHRPRIIMHEGEATIDRMRSRARWQAKRGAGEGATATITTTGWRDGNGRLWSRNWLVYVKDPLIGIDGMMVIKSVTLSQAATDGGEGTTATLLLADPRALGGENPRGKTAKGFAAVGDQQAEYEDE